MPLDPNERAIIQRLEDALQMALLLVARLAPDIRQSAEDASQTRDALSRAVEAVKHLQLAESASRGSADPPRRQAKAGLSGSATDVTYRRTGKKR